MKRFSIKCMTIISSILLCSGAVFGYELDGTMTPTGDDTYSVRVQNSYGRVFVGTAQDQGDGELEVTVHDQEGNVYSGYALDNSNGGYVLDLQNDATGDDATGTIEEK